MTAEKLLEHCTRLGIKLFVHAGELAVDVPRSGPNAWLGAQLSTNRQELISLLTSREDAAREEHRREVEQYGAEITKRRQCPHCHSGDIALIPTCKPPHWASLRCVACEKFLGWAPMPKELAAEWPYPFEPYRGMTLAAIAEIDPDFLKWAARNTFKPRIREMVAYFLEHMCRMPSDSAASQPADSVVAADDGDEIGF